MHPCFKKLIFDSHLFVYIKDSGAAILVSTPEYADMLEPIAIDLDLPFVVFDHMEPMRKNYYRGHFESQNMSLKRRALFIYTSGTTGKVSAHLSQTTSICSNLGISN